MRKVNIITKDLGKKLHFTKYLMSIGFRSYRHIDGINVERDYSLDFSSLTSGMCDIRFIKGDLICCWGLYEKGLAPNLIWPKILTDGGEIWEQSLIDRYFKKYSNEEIYDSLFNGIKLIELK